MSQTTNSTFDPYYRWLGISPKEQPPDHYRLLAIEPFEDDPQVIENAADQRMGHLRTFQTGKHAQFSQKLLNEVAAAKICLLNPDKKAAYDALLRQELQTDGCPAEACDTDAELESAAVGLTRQSNPRKFARQPRLTTGKRRAKLLVVAGAVIAVVLLGLAVKSGQQRQTIRPVRQNVDDRPSARNSFPAQVGSCSPSPGAGLSQSSSNGQAAGAQQTSLRDTAPATTSWVLDPKPPIERPVFEKPIEASPLRTIDSSPNFAAPPANSEARPHRDPNTPGRQPPPKKPTQSIWTDVL